ncbi:maleylpyruvate isomerase N-terminal domain-containing protein [Kineococcus rhizosphaerae]|uniref:Mycothiol maleylpyruvate isomerase-like protein n=1 Tax=Kineococcus rhizosphaerae TaxID=559628 RepID=A0A2T0R7I4_9ACTN|nr:maleylpyruvate isomerase N-terminal domain-containing protein [Kineococcus rhizosphaerae]PRY17129.1 mycothiol maleylpyruvate isomerase-like protein [Kineococcus rhizosphaerae]
MTLHLTHDEGRAALADELASWSLVLGSDLDLDAPSRCPGWTCAHVLVHVHLGLQEVALALLDVQGPGPVTVDAAGYWTRYPATTDPEGQFRVLDGTARAYPRPETLTGHLAATVEALRRGVLRVPDGRVAFQGFTFSTGDFLGSWAVELAVHQLDLELIAAPPPGSGLRLARRTVDDLAGGAVPADWDDATVVLAGTGRVELAGEAARQHPELRGRFPVLG